MRMKKYETNIVCYGETIKTHSYNIPYVYLYRLISLSKTQGEQVYVFVQMTAEEIDKSLTRRNTEVCTWLLMLNCILKDLT